MLILCCGIFCHWVSTGSRLKTTELIFSAWIPRAQRIIVACCCQQIPTMMTELQPVECLVRWSLQWAATLSSNCITQNQFTVDRTACSCFTTERKRQRCYGHFVRRFVKSALDLSRLPVPNTKDSIHSGISDKPYVTEFMFTLNRKMALWRTVLGKNGSIHNWSMQYGTRLLHGNRCSCSFQSYTNSDDQPAKLSVSNVTQYMFTLPLRGTEWWPP